MDDQRLDTLIKTLANGFTVYEPKTITARVRRFGGGYFGTLTLDGYVKHGHWYKTKQGARNWAKKHAPNLQQERANFVAYYKHEPNHKMDTDPALEQWDIIA